MDEKGPSGGTRNAWILVALGILYIVVHVALAMWTNRPGPPPSWDMDGTPFVPASSHEAEGYYQSVPGNPARPAEAE